MPFICYALPVAGLQIPLTVAPMPRSFLSIPVLRISVPVTAAQIPELIGPFPLVCRQIPITVCQSRFEFPVLTRCNRSSSLISPTYSLFAKGKFPVPQNRVLSSKPLSLLDERA
jgi:hypothetical protein